MALRSGQLDRVPPEYEPDGPGGGVPTREYAHDLLAALQAAESGTRPSAEVIAAIHAFRAWVTARLQNSRRVILAEEGGPILHLPPQRRTPPPPPPAGRRPDAGDAVAIERPPTLLDHPLWDRWLDE